MWSGWSDKLQHILPGSTVCASERGYFGLPFEAATRASNSNKGSLLVICHSLGLHLVSPALLQKCDGLVLIGSFRNFHGGSDREQKLSRTKVRRMSAKIQIDPALVLQDFYRSAGFDWSAGFQPASDPTTHDHDLNTNLLHDDLQLLDQCDLDIRLLQQIPKFNSAWRARHDRAA